MEQNLDQYHLPATALTCLNGLRHGAASETLFIPGEDPSLLYTLLAESFETHKPATTADAAIVTDSVYARWYLWRRQRAYAKRESEFYSFNTEPDTITPTHIHELALFERYRTQAERAFQRAHTNVQNLKKSALAESKWREQLELQKARLDLQRQRFEFRQAQAAAKLASNPPDSPIKIEAATGERIIEQNISVTHQPDGPASITATPSNEIVQDIIAHLDRYLIPPTKIVRRLTFTDGRIPAEFQWILDNADKSSFADSTDPHPTVRNTLTFDEFLSLLAA
jgi:hypothetical protein